MKRPTNNRNRGAATLPKGEPTTSDLTDTRRKTLLSDESARATVKATMASGFPAPAQLAAHLGEQAIAEIEAELAAERAAATQTNEA